MHDFEPYYVAIFTSKRTGEDEEGYGKMDEKTFNLVEDQPGFMGADSFYDDEGKHVTIVKFRTKEDMIDWRNNPVHREAQTMGREKWYEFYNVKICKVEREYEFNR